MESKGISNTTELARTYIRRGYSPIPVPFGTKIPVLDNWQNLRIGPHDVERYFPPGVPLNVGALNGDPSEARVDIDSDCDEAGRLASLFLPTTAMFGRPGNPNSHWIFRTSPVKPTKQFRDPLRLKNPREKERAMLLEHRSNGTQTLYPGSTHPSSELIEWANDCEPTQIDADELFVKLHKLALGALVLRYYPAVGARHDFFLAFAAVLLRDGWTQEEAEDFIRIVATVAHDEETGDRVRCVASTAERLAARQSVTGWTKLKTLLDPNLIPTFKRWIAGARKPNAGGDWAANDDEQAQFQPNVSAERPSVSTRLVEMSERLHLFHAPDGEAYAARNGAGNNDISAIRSEAFRDYLARLYYDEFGTVPNESALADAGRIIRMRALDGPEEPVFLRVGWKGDAVYLDLCDPDRRVVEVSDGLWRIVKDSPVRFRRRRGMLALPAPTWDGRPEDLRPFVNVSSDNDFRLFIAWLIGSLYPRAQCPILILQGPQGAAKTSLARAARMLIDPSSAPVRALPEKEHDLAISADNSWLLVFDNLSFLSENISNALCRICTGAGVAYRRLYSDRDEELFEAQRPIILTSIDDIASRFDLLDRAIVLNLPPIPDDKRQDESTLWAEFEKARPKILGALLRGLCVALHSLHDTKLVSTTRFGDFCRVVNEAAAEFEWEEGAMQLAIEANRSATNNAATNADLVGAAMRDAFGVGKETSWRGTATALLEKLRAVTDEQAQRTRGWPKTPQFLSKCLKRVMPALKDVGIVVELNDRIGHASTRIIRITVERADDDSRPAEPTTLRVVGSEDLDSSRESTNADDADDDPLGLCNPPWVGES